MEAPRIQQTINILYGAFLASSLVYVLVAVFLQTTQWRPPQPQLGEPLFAGLLVVAVVCAALVLRQKNVLFSGDGARIKGEYRSFVVSRCVLWLALSEVPAILGFVLFILTGNLLGLLILVAISGAAFTLARPSLTQLEQLERRLIAKTDVRR